MGFVVSAAIASVLYAFNWHTFYDTRAHSADAEALQISADIKGLRETLPDDRYRIDVYGFDDAERGIVGLRNQEGELLVPRSGVTGAERVEFELRLGAQIEFPT